MKRRGQVDEVAELTERLTSGDPAAWMTQDERDRLFDLAGAGALPDRDDQAGQLARYWRAAHGDTDPLGLVRQVESAITGNRRREMAHRLAELTGQRFADLWDELTRSLATDRPAYRHPGAPGLRYL